MRLELTVAVVLAAAAACTGSAPGALAPPASSSLTPTATPTASAPSTPVSTPPAPTPTPSPASSQPTCLAVSAWPVDRLAAAVLLAPARLEHLDRSLPLVRSGVGGLVLFGKPGSDVAQQLHALHLAAGAWPLVVASDEEGGGIQRLAALTGGLPWPRDLAAQSPAVIRAEARTMGRRLRALGVRVDLAPVADLDAGPGPDADHPDGRRSFSADPDVATRDVLAFAAGLQDAGIVPVVKHFPGLGTASGNTDAKAAQTAPLDALRTRDLRPFAAAARAGLPVVMTSNAIVPGLSPLPVSVSAAATRLLRSLGFNGVVITDSLSATAISAAGFTVEQATVRAIAAGADAAILGGGDTMNPTSMISSVRAALSAAVRTGQLPVARLRTAVRELAQLMGVRTC